MFIADPEKTKKALGLLEQLVEKQEELANIEAKLRDLGFIGQSAVPNVTVGPSRKQDPPDGTDERRVPDQGPRQSEERLEKAPAARERSAGSDQGSRDRSADGERPRRGLEKLLLELVRKSQNGLSLAEMVTQALERGYESKSNDFHNMVQQAAGRMVKKKVLVRNPNMRYVAAGGQAA